ncbi:uncharacterized protein LOC127807895 isoform X2 [Diospyros lotus]|uniref:uncharacterized protein LOC127807895 isoform X2 n=1 Tax=Diospyros lotus TaxID=55363 RepID=UPI00225714C6|nr:uncharacterized protein LOC127807895 isoform X2 [Diospyros lotus]
MKAPISNSLTPHLILIPRFPSPNFLFRFPPLSRESPCLLSFSHRKWLYHPKTLTFCSGAPSFGGWDDPRLGGGSALSGFVCALAISRVRVSSTVLFPACAIVFAVGFSIGFVNWGHANNLNLVAAKKKPKDETFRVSVEKLRNLVHLLAEFDDKISNLKNGIRRGIENSHVTVGDLQRYSKAMESIRLSSLNARSVVDACIDVLSVENRETERILNQKSSRRKKEVGEAGFDLFQYIGGLFQESSVSSKPNKMKDSVKRGSVHVEVNDRSRGNILGMVGEEQVITSSASIDDAGNQKAAFSRDILHTPDMVRSGEEMLDNEARRINVLLQDDEIKISDREANRKVMDNELYSYQNNRPRFINNQQISLMIDHHNGVETWASQDNFLDSVDFSVNLKHMQTEALVEREEILHRTNGSYRPSQSRENREEDIYKPRSVEKERVIREDEQSIADHPSERKNDSFPSSTVSDDIMFNGYLMQANALLKEARKCLKVSGDEGHAETVLYKSAKLLSKALDMKPMSLLAVGQLGNTYLLHGELKLKMSRHLRALLANKDTIFVHERPKVLKGLEDELTSKDKIASALVNVCEDCEELLVQAGRRYRFALSIDGDDMRALYNWGLALSFRAQLIADIGPEAAFDADKVFLAAIDKFDAMMSRSNVYTPDALFRWGLALQQRSRLRPRNSKEKVKLLQQAKRLYEDALNMDYDNLQVREALHSCISELSFRSY